MPRVVMRSQAPAQQLGQAVADAIRACYTGLLTQDELNAITGIPQATISKWARGASAPNALQQHAIEAACDARAVELDGEDSHRRRPPGWIGIQAGLVQIPGATVPEAVVRDPALIDDHARRSVLLAYQGVVENYVPVTVEDLRRRFAVGTQAAEERGELGE